VNQAVAKAPWARDLAHRVGRARIICLGLSALDQIWRVDELFIGGSEKIRSAEYSTTGGGMAANAAVTVARLGGQVAFWGRAGEDIAGRAMRDGLAQEGVDVAQFKLFSGASSVSGIIVDAAGERQIVNFRGRLPDTSDWLPLGDVASAAAVLADPRWVPGALALFRAAGVPTVLDAEVAEREAFDALLPLTDHAIFSEPALQAFAGTSHTRALAVIAGFGCRVAAVTLGARGVVWCADDLISRQVAHAVAAVDTSGAGDVFHGAYALAIGAGLRVREAISLASAAAALKCTRSGGRAGIPTLEECLAFQRTHP
jgi:sulfofructose kinase